MRFLQQENTIRMSVLQTDETYSTNTGKTIVVCLQFSIIFKDLFLLDKSIIYEEIENRIVINIINYKFCFNRFYEIKQNYNSIHNII